MPNELSRSTVAPFGCDRMNSPSNPPQGYAAFPSAVMLPSGNLLAAYTRGIGHNTPDSKLVLNHSVGHTWGSVLSEQVLQDTLNRCDTNCTLTVLKSGRIFAVYVKTFAVNGAPTIQDRDCYCRFSDDQGVTWSPEVYISPQGFTLHMTPGGRVIELADGTLVLPTYAVNTGEFRYTSLLLQSVDNGTTWTTRGIIAQDASPNGTQWEEPQVARLQDNRLMALVRDDATAFIYACYSGDDGVTWTLPVAAYPGNGWPVWKQLSNGTIIALQRDPVDGPQKPKYVLSQDNGVHWSKGIELMPNAVLHSGASTYYPLYMYGDILELTPNIATVLVGYGNQISAGGAGIDHIEYAIEPIAPSDYAQVAGWWDSDDLFPKGTIGNGEVIPLWKDRSGYSRDFVGMNGDSATNGWPKRQRSMPTGALNAKEQGFVQYGRLWVATPFTLAQPFAISVVHTVNDYSGDRWAFDFRNNDGNGWWRMSGGKFYANFGSANAFSGSSMGSAVPVIDTLIVASGTAKWRRNGIETGSGPVGTNGITALTYTMNRAKTVGGVDPNTFAILLYVYENDAQVLFLEQWLAKQKAVTFT